MAKRRSAAAALSALVLAVGGCAGAVTRGVEEPNPDADIRGGTLDTCDVTWSCLHPAAVAAGHSLLAPSGLHQWPGGGSLTWSQDGWSYKLAIGDTSADPLTAQQVITTLTNQATHLSSTS